MKKLFVVNMLVLLGCGGAWAQPLKLPMYNAHPQTANFSFHCKETFPKGQPSKVVAPQKLDVRSCNISSWDLSSYTADELADVLSFDSKTVFPPAAKLPKDFSPQKLLENGKNPGLGVRALHAKGITGKGVSVAVIDQNLLLEHGEYATNVMYYEEDSFWNHAGDASMHAPAVVSLIAGKNAGVAPQARVFALAPSFGRSNAHQYDATPVAHALHEILQLNKKLPKEKKIRVVSISRGFSEYDFSADEFKTAKAQLEKSGVAVFTTNDVFTLSRKHALDNPDKKENYCRPAYWLEAEDLQTMKKNSRDVVVPTDFRTTASPTGTGDYVHYAQGGLSWAVPYVAGLYALGVQVYPQLTKKTFLKAVRATSAKQTCEFQGTSFSSSLVQPARLIDYLQALNAE